MSKRKLRRPKSGKSLDDVMRELKAVNEERHKKGWAPLSYGQYVSIIEPTTPYVPRDDDTEDDE